MNDRTLTHSTDSEVAPSAPGLATLASWDSPRHYATIFLAIVAIAFALRLVHLYQAERLPFFYSLISDAHSYDEWSKKIVAGDWIGREVFYQAPLYPYFLAVTQLVTGHDFWRIRVVQIALGSVACGLLFLAGRRFFSPAVGALAGLIAACYPPAIFFDCLIQKAVLDNFFMCVLLWLLANLSRRLSFGSALGAGVVLGCFALTRENVILFFPIVALWLLVRHASLPIPPRAAALVALTLGVALVLAPVGLRNKHIGGAFLVTTSQFGPNFFIGNNENATGFYVPLRPGREDPIYERADATDMAQQALGRRLTPAEVSDYWLSKALAWIRSRPATWLRLMGYKSLLLVNYFELPDAEDIYFYETECPLIRRLGVVLHFGVLAPLAVAGLILTWKRRREIWILHVLLLVLGIGVLLFFVLSRYRFPVVPILVLFAAAGLVEAARVVRRSGPLALDWVVVLAGLAAVVINRPMIPTSLNTAKTRSNAGTALLQAGRIDAAIDEFQQSLRIDPSLAMTHINLASAYWRQGRLPESIQCLQRALQLSPNDLETELALGNAFAEDEQPGEAEPHLLAALAIAHRRPEVFTNLGVVLIRLKKWDQAIEVLRRGAREAPDQPGILANLAWNLATCPSAEYRNGPDAVQIAEACCKKTGFRDPGMLDVLAAGYAEVGRFTDAVAAEQRALVLAAASPSDPRAAEFQNRLRLYESSQPYRRPP